jgi:hypothetical protein
MKNTAFLLLLCLPIVVSAHIEDLLYFPKKGEAAGSTSVVMTNSELSGSLNGTEVTLSGTRTSLKQQLAFGLTDVLAVGIYVDHVSSAISDAKVGTVTVSSDVKTGIQSPTLLFGGRFKFNNEEVLNFNFLDARFFLNPKGSDDNASRSDFYAVDLQTGAVLSEEQEVSISLSYTSYNANIDLESDSETNLNFGYKKDMSNSLFLKLKAGLANLTQTKYKTSGDTIDYANAYLFSFGVGGEIKPETFTWLISYQAVKASADYKIGLDRFPADLVGNTFNFGVGYIF